MRHVLKLGLDTMSCNYDETKSWTQTLGLWTTLLPPEQVYSPFSPCSTVNLA